MKPKLIEGEKQGEGHTRHVDKRLKVLITEFFMGV
jgi:hypothetical protein